MAEAVLSFSEVPEARWREAGGKGGKLVRMLQAGYPVPPGLVVFPDAFDADDLRGEAWRKVQLQLAALRTAHPDARFAVRSSALAEDSASASFAGEFETVLDVATDADIRDAILRVYRSRRSGRVESYSHAQGLTATHEMAVLIQRLVPAELSGVLFTADPVTGSYRAMVGNYVRGLGEALVSGEVNPETFTIERPAGHYQGPDEMRRHARPLFRFAVRLEQDFAGPQDIEWTVAEGRLHLLQARPVTTLSTGNSDTYQINESLGEDTLWVNTNVAEAIPDVFTPLTWSLVRRFDQEVNLIPGYYIWSGNICGRVYSNIGRRVSISAALTGWDVRRVMALLGDLFGPVPSAVTVPLHPYRRREAIRIVAPRFWSVLRKTARAALTLSRYLERTPTWCRQMAGRIQSTESEQDLLTLWHDVLEPYAFKAWWSHTAGSARIVVVMALDRKLTALVGKEDANALLSNLQGNQGLASMGPLLALAALRNGKMSEQAYLEQYGHRGPHEFELSIPAPAEDPHWFERQLAKLEVGARDAEALIEQQRARHHAARRRFEVRFPRKIRWLDRQLQRAARGAHLREAARSEFTRVFRVVRAFALRAGTLTGIGEDVFFLYLPELLALLSGNREALSNVTARRATHARYQSWPAFPSVIRGRFDPEEWLRDPDRRSDYYDAQAPRSAAQSLDELQGYPGAAGRVEGTVRVLSRPEDGDRLLQGEILVAATTNVGWTPLFPKAGAIVTDVGAPLSHAAIVARELGIPAVVGCGNATARLKTGDRVMVDGGQGSVQLLQPQ
jgi:pyruvate,water dikinase